MRTWLRNQSKAPSFRRGAYAEKSIEKTIACIEERIERIPFSGCWIWMRGSFQDKYEYGEFQRYGEHKAHRSVWTAFKGRIPHGLWVLHRCDIPLCVNPDHLFLGTAEDNMRDMATKGRARRCKNG